MPQARALAAGVRFALTKSVKACSLHRPARHRVSKWIWRRSESFSRLKLKYESKVACRMKCGVASHNVLSALDYSMFIMCHATLSVMVKIEKK